MARRRRVLQAPVVGALGIRKRKRDDWFPVLTPAMSARNRKRCRLLNILHHDGVKDLGFKGELPADWTGFLAEVVENLKAFYKDNVVVSIVNQLSDPTDDELTDPNVEDLASETLGTINESIAGKEKSPQLSNDIQKDNLPLTDRTVDAKSYSQFLYLYPGALLTLQNCYIQHDIFRSEPSVPADARFNTSKRGRMK